MDPKFFLQICLQDAYYQGKRSLAPIYRLVFPTILKLAGDDDRVIKDLVKTIRSFVNFEIGSLYLITLATYLN